MSRLVSIIAAFIGLFTAAALAAQQPAPVPTYKAAPPPPALEADNSWNLDLSTGGRVVVLGPVGRDTEPDPDAGDQRDRRSARTDSQTTPSPTAMITVDTGISSTPSNRSVSAWARSCAIADGGC